MVCAIFIFQTRSRACLKKAFRELRVSVCGRFYPNEGDVAGYGNRMRVKYTAKLGLQIAEMIFQTHSSITHPHNSLQVHVVFSFQVMYTHFKQQILSPGEVIRYVFVRVSEDSHVPNIPSFSRYFYRFRKDSYDSGYYPTSSL